MFRGRILPIMENKHFKTDYLSYWTRARRAFVAAFLAVTAIIFYVYFSREQPSFPLALLSVLAFGVVYGFIQLYHSRQFINEVTFISDRIIIKGYTFNKQWKEDLRIADIKIEIKSKGRG